MDRLQEKIFVLTKRTCRVIIKSRQAREERSDQCGHECCYKVKEHIPVCINDIAKSITIEHFVTSFLRALWPIQITVGRLVKTFRGQKEVIRDLQICIYLEDGRPFRPDYIYKRFQKNLQKHGLKRM